MLQAAEEDFAEVIKEQYEAQKKVNEAQDLHNEALKNAENAETQLRSAIEERNSSANSSISQESIDNYTASLEMATQKEEEARETLEGYQAELQMQKIMLTWCLKRWQAMSRN